MKRFFPALVCLLLPALAAAQDFDSLVEAELRPGWRLKDGDHMAALHIRLAPGWKTYWRAPGDAGIPPDFDWQDARNAEAVAVLWPAPHVFWQLGMRSVGYKDEVVLPLRVALRDTSSEAFLKGVIDIGICQDVCVPARIEVEAVLPAGGSPDPRIAAALADQPLSAAQAGVRGVRCTVTPEAKGLGLRAEIDMPGYGKADVVIEADDPQIWVAEPETTLEDGLLVAQTRLRHAAGGAFALDRSGLRFTVLGRKGAVDIRGCKG